MSCGTGPWESRAGACEGPEGCAGLSARRCVLRGRARQAWRAVGGAREPQPEAAAIPGHEPFLSLTYVERPLARASGPGQEAGLRHRPGWNHRPCPAATQGGKWRRRFGPRVKPACRAGRRPERDWHGPEGTAPWGSARACSALVSRGVPASVVGYAESCGLLPWMAQSVAPRAGFRVQRCGTAVPLLRALLAAGLRRKGARGGGLSTGALNRAPAKEAAPQPPPGPATGALSPRARSWWGQSRHPGRCCPLQSGTVCLPSSRVGRRFLCGDLAGRRGPAIPEARRGASAPRAAWQRSVSRGEGDVISSRCGPGLRGCSPCVPCEGHARVPGPWAGATSPAAGRILAKVKACLRLPSLQLPAVGGPVHLAELAGGNSHARGNTLPRSGQPRECSFPCGPGPWRPVAVASPTPW